MDTITPSDPNAPTNANGDVLGNSFDLLARQDMADSAIGALRSDVDEVKSRLEKVSRAASRPVLDGGAPAQSMQVKSFFDGYLRHGDVSELKSLSGAASADGGYAVPREIDAMIGAQLMRHCRARAWLAARPLLAGHPRRTDGDPCAARRGIGLAVTR